MVAVVQAYGALECALVLTSEAKLGACLQGWQASPSVPALLVLLPALSRACCVFECWC